MDAMGLIEPINEAGFPTERDSIPCQMYLDSTPLYALLTAASYKDSLNRLKVVFSTLHRMA